MQTPKPSSNASRIGRGCLASLFIYLWLTFLVITFLVPFDWALALWLGINPGALIFIGMAVGLVAGWLVFMVAAYPESNLGMKIRQRVQDFAAAFRRRATVITIVMVTVLAVLCIFWTMLEGTITNDPRYKATATQNYIIQLTEEAKKTPKP
jgi:fucose 4-O-acetylase-like acetyltransferase